MHLQTPIAADPAAPELHPGHLLRRQPIAVLLALGALLAWPIGGFLVYFGQDRFLTPIIYTGVVGLLLSAFVGIFALVQLLTEKSLRERLWAAVGLVLAAAPWVVIADLLNWW